jgi:hypothetical protein
VILLQLADNDAAEDFELGPAADTVVSLDYLRTFDAFKTGLAGEFHTGEAQNQHSKES